MHSLKIELQYVIMLIETKIKFSIPLETVKLSHQNLI